MWLAALWFIAGGVLCLAMLVLDGDSLSNRDRIALFVIGCGVLAGGIYFMFCSPRVVVVFDLVEGRVRYESGAPFRRAVRIDVPVADVEGYSIQESRDSEGDPWHQLYLKVAGHRPLLLTGASHYNRATLSDVCSEISSALDAMRR